MIRLVHAAFFYLIYDRIAVVLPSPIVFGSMYMHYQGLTTDTLGQDPRLIGQPIVSMNNIKIVFARYSSCYQGIAIHFFQEVFSVFSREIIKALIVILLCLYFGTFFLPIGSKNFWREIGTQCGTYFHELNMLCIVLGKGIILKHLFLTGIDNASRLSVFVSRGLGHHKENLYLILGQSLGKTKACGT